MNEKMIEIIDELKQINKAWRETAIMEFIIILMESAYIISIWIN